MMHRPVADLDGLTLKQVKAKAKGLGVGDELDAAIQALLKAEAGVETQLREGLADLNLKQLKARATEAGASDEAIEECDEAADAKAAAADLVISLELA